jgi:tetratricopeptide (TPR) repeat protein
LGYVLTLRGDLDGAVREETLAIDALTGDPRLLAGSLAYRGRAHLAAGELERAEADARAACAVDRASSAGLLAEAALAEVLLARHRPAEALERALRACELADGAGPVEAGDALARLCRVRALAALGKDARPLARAAWRRIVARANKIADDSLRARFLTRIPEHRATRSFVT